VDVVKEFHYGNGLMEKKNGLIIFQDINPINMVILLKLGNPLPITHGTI